LRQLRGKVVEEGVSSLLIPKPPRHPIVASYRTRPSAEMRPEKKKKRKENIEEKQKRGSKPSSIQSINDDGKMLAGQSTTENGTREGEMTWHQMLA
jgi:hypothetical protein